MIVDLLLPPPPAHWDKSRESKVHKKIAECISKAIEPAGHAFMGRVRRHKHKRTLSEDFQLEEALREANSEDVLLEEDEPETPRLLKSDPSKWKCPSVCIAVGDLDHHSRRSTTQEQDHYAILGLSKLRFRATDEDIKRAYRRKVLKHHPDKKASASGKTNDDSFFKCVQKAWEVLSDTKKRREWDSCDPQFDESIPSAKAKGDFFEIYAPVFEKESRFSKKPAVPQIGDINSTREEVETFYDFWFNFESWRTFEMMDEEDADGAEGREEKRWIERKNKAARAKLKKEDNARVNRLVEQAFSLDPRIRKFKEQERAAKEAKRREKELQSKSAEIEAAKKAEEERIAREAAEAEEKARREVEKAKREQLKNAIRKEKKTIKRMLRDNNNFLAADASPDAVVNQIERLDFILEQSEFDHLESFRARLEEAAAGGADALLLVFDEEHLAAEERAAAAKAAAAGDAAAAAASKSADDDTLAAKPEWTPKEITTLIKAVKLFPGGASARWEKIAEYISEHGGPEGEAADDKAARQRTPKECILQSKKMQTAAAADRQRLQQAAAKSVSKVEIKEAPSERIEPVAGDATPTASQTTMLAPPNPAWSTEQQLALEQALRKFPASAFTANPAERWEKIAGEVPGKNKKDIKQRVKELAEMVKKKTK
ncbi:Zuotin [Polyrhizophydium stewartii]|uniref:Zuotin n=1 Tax=Polyrhizophydium stewartii TaxID=2732419 RepID=A0ABR4MX79_9FUNG